MNLVSIAAEVSPDVGPPDFVAAAAAAAWPACGIWVDPTTWTDETTRDVRRVLSDVTRFLSSQDASGH